MSDLVALLEARPACVLAYSAAATMDVEGRTKGHWPGAGRMDYQGTRLRRGLRYLWWTEWQKGIAFHCIVRTSALSAAGGLTPIRFAADDLWLFRLSLLGAFAYDPRPLFRKRLHRASASANYGRRFGEWMEYILAHRDVVREAGLSERENQAVSSRRFRLRQAWLVCFWPVILGRRLLSRLKRFALGPSPDKGGAGRERRGQEVTLQAASAVWEKQPAPSAGNRRSTRAFAACMTGPPAGRLMGRPLHWNRDTKCPTIPPRSSVCRSFQALGRKRLST